MREVKENPSGNRLKASKFADQNQMPKGTNKIKSSTNASRLRSASSWGSHIVKGFSAEKKTRSESDNTLPPFKKQQPLTASQSQSRVKRSLMSDLSCSVNAIQVHPHSRDLFLEIDHLRNLLRDSKERELELQAELSKCKKPKKELDIERELELKKNEVENLNQKVHSLEQQLASFASRNEGHMSSKSLEMEVVELRRLNKELQLQKRNLSCRLSSLESQLATLVKVSESEIVEKIKAEASLLRHANEDLSKQVEGLQMSRLNEVEELVYLRWVNSCLQSELQKSQTAINLEDAASSNSDDWASEIISLSSSSQGSDLLESVSGNKLTLIKMLKKWSVGNISENLECPDIILEKIWMESPECTSPRRHSISGSKCCREDLVLRKRRQSDGFMYSKETEKEAEEFICQSFDFGSAQRSQQYGNSQDVNKLAVSLDIEKRALRVPNPPPRPSISIPCEPKEGPAQIPLSQAAVPPPPPPPPPPPKLSMRSTAGTVQRAPQVVEFYHSLMRRDSRKDSQNGGTADAIDVENARSSMIGEIENRSSHLLAIKADIETQGEFVNSLIREVNNAVYQNIEDVVAFVKWLDDELCFLVDERAVLKHFDWPEKKADTLREAAFGYRDLKKMEYDVVHFVDDPRLPCDIALKKMVALSEKMERTVYNLIRTRESLMRQCKEFQIPTDWMIDAGIISKIKLGSVRLAKKYMKRVAMELQSKGVIEKDPTMDYMLLQGVRFAFHIHQFAGGFDTDTMHAFEELRNLANLLRNKK
ncbi:hypothetical protein RJ641_017658 [Dillenia turbinata]|uniref:Protein CHUP1, chloroplastic-like n=1 Tax=Dillenia turbinata TaxID=194707 RepID=A0AAN8YXU3_9MAGN